MASPTQLSLRYCRKQKWPVDIAEKWVAQPPPGHRKDLFGFIDLVVFDGEQGTLFVQATSASNVPARVTKIQTFCAPVLARILRAGNRVEVWGWEKRGAHWELDRREVTSVTNVNQLWRPPRRRARRKKPEHEQLTLMP